MDNASLRSDESYTPTKRQRATRETRYGRESTVTPSSDEESVSYLTPSTLGAGQVTLPCDVCEIEANLAFRYCPNCCQKMCGLCEEMHARFGGTVRHTTVQCMSKTKLVDKDLLKSFRERNELNFCQVVDLIKYELGLQVCANYVSTSVTLLADDDQVLDLACDTVKQLGNDTINQGKNITKRVKHGKIEWTICGESAIITLKLFVDEMTLFSEHHSVEVVVFSNDTQTSWTKFVETISDRSSSQSGRTSRQAEQYLRQAQEKHLFDSMSDLRDIDTKITVTCDPGAYTEVDYGLRDIVDALHTVALEEVARPNSDVFRMKVYALLKETDNNVLCTVKQTDSGYKLGIRAKDKDTVQATKQEFLSIFCKECSHCQRECSSPVYLACKHVLCSGCVIPDPSLTTTAQCPLCADQLREKTPIISLQVQAFQALDRTLHRTLSKTNLGNRARATKSSYTAQTQASLKRKGSSLGKPQMSTKIPKFLLNKWKRATGGLARLRALLEQNFGLRVGGTGDRLAIYGHQQEILDLAVHTLEHLNESVPETGVSIQLRDGSVEWRLRGETAHIAYFLFKETITNIRQTFKTVKIQAFTETSPPIVDVTCGYQEYLKVKFELEELENDIKNLYVDEYIQPKNFYYNVKVQEFLLNKRRDPRVFCTLVLKNNLNVMIFKGRSKEYVQEAKDQLSNW